MPQPDSGQPADPLPPSDGLDLAEVARRIARSIAAAESAAPESQPQAILFQAGSLRLALPLASVREVVMPPQVLSRVPRAPAALLGIMNLRGRVIAVVDLLHALPGSVGAAQPGEPPGHDLAAGRVLLLDRNRRDVGLLVRAVGGIAPLPSREGGTHALLDPDEVGAAIEALVT